MQIPNKVILGSFKELPPIGTEEDMEAYIAQLVKASGIDSGSDDNSIGAGGKIELPEPGSFY